MDFNSPFANVPNEAFEKQVSEITGNEQRQPFETINEQTEKLKEKPPTIKAGGRSAFQPVQSSDADHSDNIPSFNEDDIFNMMSDSFDKKMETPGISGGNEQGQKTTFARTPRASSPTEVMDRKELELGAVFFVEILEMVTVVVCEWISGIPNGYRFKTTLKEKFAVITAKLAEREKVFISPMHLWLLGLVILAGSPILQAIKDKKKRIKLEKFAEKSNRRNVGRAPGEQNTLFDLEPIVQGRTKFDAVMEDGIAYYTKKPNGEYCKKAEREEVPPELVTELFNFQKRHGTWPTKKQVEAFLKQV